MAWGGAAAPPFEPKTPLVLPYIFLILVNFVQLRPTSSRTRNVQGSLKFVPTLRGGTIFGVWTKFGVLMFFSLKIVPAFWVGEGVEEASAAAGFLDLGEGVVVVDHRFEGISDIGGAS